MVGEAVSAEAPWLVEVADVEAFAVAQAVGHTAGTREDRRKHVAAALPEQEVGHWHIDQRESSEGYSRESLGCSFVTTADLSPLQRLAQRQ